MNTLRILLVLFSLVINGCAAQKSVSKYKDEIISLNSLADKKLEPGILHTLRSGCGYATCNGRHAIVFVHGIYGGAGTFKNTDVDLPFNWPEQVPMKIDDSPVDVYQVEYQSALISWAKEDIASLDQVVEAIYPPLAELRARGYSSINFVAHSLGGNVVKAYLHSVKSEEGHIERARHGFVLTVGTPVNGASIANVGLLLKKLLGMQDPLLSSLQRDNTFLRMMNLWGRQEDTKSTKFRCRPVHLYAGIETKPIGPIQIVDIDSAQKALPNFAVSRTFPLNHSEIAKPRSTCDELFLWFLEIAGKEIKRVNQWGPTRELCEKQM
ncbi:MAG TPA: hypothetical protein VES38_02825 [Methylotenera sp.]|nr:hypothetical protein [Methylotenera sp.]